MKTTAIVVLAFVMTGCASVSGYKPIINDRAERKMDTVNRDIKECQILAAQAAGFGAEGISGAIAGSAGAASSGAVAGAILGGVSAGPMAAITAPLGGIAGLWWSEYEANIEYKETYKNCLFQRGHSPL